MLKVLKLFYWKLETYVFEIYIKIKPLQAKGKANDVKEGLVVSLTSYPGRFETLSLTLKSLLLQTVRPNLLILWIDENAYKSLPTTIRKWENAFDWFEVRTCDDIRSYTKLVPSLICFPDKYIVTADDDVYYPPQWLEKLTSKITPNKEIISHRVHQVTFKNGKPRQYNEWALNSNATDGIIFATGIGGVLYPPNAFPPDVINQDVFLDICGGADDIWFFWMAKKNGTNIVWSGYNFNVINWSGTDDTGLAQLNVGKGENDICIEKMTHKYGDFLKAD